jgi:hypothetical protein
MAYRLNPIVAKASPNLYAAAKAANIPMEQGTQLEQFGWTVDKNKKLNQLPIDAVFISRIRLSISRTRC